MFGKKKKEEAKADVKKKDKAKKVEKAKGENFFRGIKGELKRVTWPTWDIVKSNTITVIAVLLVIGAFVYVLDIGFGLGSSAVIRSK
ncbi:preprotein translocase subunit SecE, partial [Treponema sp. R6D11]